MFLPFYFIFSYNNSLISRLIRKISNGRFSHCSLVLNELHTLEVSWNKPCVIEHFSYQKGNFEVYKLNTELTDSEQKIIKRYIISNISTGYDFLYVFTRGLNILFGTPIRNSKKTMSCDELIVESFKQIGISLVEDDILLSPESLSKSKYLTKARL